MAREYFAYGSVLEALSSGLYPDKRHVIREFVQNAFDAVNDWKKISGEQSLNPVEIRIQKPSIFIADRGIGMDENQAQIFRYLGYSTKDRYLGYSTKDRKEDVGFRGIGKDSGIAVAEKIIVTTSRYQIPKRYTIVIDAQKMLEETASGENPPLEELLERNTTLKEEPEVADLHYTFVELHNIRKDSYTLFDTDKLKDYLRRNCPVPLAPQFTYSDEIMQRLKTNIPNFSSIDMKFDGENLYKPFPSNYFRPEYEPIFSNDREDAPLIAYCWYCGNKEKGQFADKDNSGLVYRVKNFAVGDRHLTRKTLWTTTPERAFYFFGEIHVLNEEVVPSSDRTDFKDNEARGNLFQRCQRIAQILSQRASTESAQRTFDESITSANELLWLREKKLKENETPIEVKPLVEYEIRKTIEDIEKRLDRTSHKRNPSVKDMELVQRGTAVAESAKEFLKKVELKKGFSDIRSQIELNEQAEQVYQVVIECLKEELSSAPDLLERIVSNINKAMTKFFKRS